jgi:uncharacterized OB-fold protein
MTTETASPTMETFWSNARRKELKFQACDACGYVRWPPAGVCPECLSRSSHWKPVEGRGRIWSFVVYHRAYQKALAAHVPYNVALVELDCGVRLVTGIVDCEASDLRIGQEVEVDFRPVFGDDPMPVFRPVSGNGGAQQ